MKNTIQLGFACLALLLTASFASCGGSTPDDSSKKITTAAKELDTFIFEEFQQDGASHMRVRCWTDKLVKTNKGRFDDGSMLVKLGFENSTVPKDAEWYEIVYPPITGTVTFKSLETDETWAVLNCKYCGDSRDDCLTEEGASGISYNGNSSQGSFSKYADDHSIRPFRPNAKVRAQDFDIDFMIPSPWTLSEKGIHLSEDRSMIEVHVCSCDAVENEIYKTKLTLGEGEQFPLKVQLKYVDPCGVQHGKGYSFIRE